MGKRQPISLPIARHYEPNLGVALGNRLPEARYQGAHPLWLFAKSPVAASGPPWTSIGNLKRKPCGKDQSGMSWWAEPPYQDCDTCDQQRVEYGPKETSGCTKHRGDVHDFLWHLDDDLEGPHHDPVCDGERGESQ